MGGFLYRSRISLIAVQARSSFTPIMVATKSSGCSGLKPSRGKNGRRKIGEIKGHDDVNASFKCCRYDVTIIVVGEHDRIDKVLVAGDEAAFDAPVHEFACAEHLGTTTRILLQELLDPLLVDLLSPAHVKKPAAGKAQQEVP